MEKVSDLGTLFKLSAFSAVPTMMNVSQSALCYEGILEGDLLFHFSFSSLSVASILP